MDEYATHFDYVYERFMSFLLETGEMKPVVEAVSAFQSRFGRLPADRTELSLLEEECVTPCP